MVPDSILAEGVSAIIVCHPVSSNSNNQFFSYVKR